MRKDDIRPEQPRLLKRAVGEIVAADAARKAKIVADTGACTCLTTWNDDPKPFVWHKTADEILDRLAGYCHAMTHGA